jgi:hypothetical protein
MPMPKIGGGESLMKKREAGTGRGFLKPRSYVRIVSGAQSQRPRRITKTPAVSAASLGSAQGEAQRDTRRSATLRG